MGFVATDNSWDLMQQSLLAAHLLMLNAKEGAVDSTCPHGNFCLLRLGMVETVDQAQDFNAESTLQSWELDSFYSNFTILGSTGDLEIWLPNIEKDKFLNINKDDPLPTNSPGRSSLL